MTEVPLHLLQRAQAAKDRAVSKAETEVLSKPVDKAPEPPPRPVNKVEVEWSTKDSGERVEFESGMRRDIQTGKPRYDLIPTGPLKRLAGLYARGAEKYGEWNWQLASSPEEIQRFKASALRHMYQYLDGETDEDHAIGAVWNLFALIYMEERDGYEALYPAREL
jgi:hypothetical protein